MYALNSAVLQHSIDDLKETYLDFTDEAASATETLIQSVLDNIQPGKAFELLLNPDKITQLANTLRNVTGTYTDSAGKTITASVGEILDSDDRSIRERIAAFESAKAAVESLGDIDLTNAFSDAYIQ